MADKEGAKTKLPRDVSHFIEIEDDLKEIEAVFRDLRKQMADANMPTVDLATGTIRHYLSLIKGMVAKFPGELTSQKNTLERERAKEATRKLLEKDAKNHARK